MNKKLLKNTLSVTKKTLITVKKTIDTTIDTSGNIAENITKKAGCSNKTVRMAKQITRGFTGATLGVAAVAGTMAASIPVALSGGAAVTAGLASITGSMLGGLALGGATTAAGAIYANKKKEVKHFELNEVSIIRSHSKSTGILVEIRKINSTNICIVNIYHKNGNLIMEGVLVDNILEGLVKEYYCNGQLRAELWYENNNPVGLLEYYTEDGNKSNDITLDHYNQMFDDEVKKFNTNDFEILQS